jgi:hypothetical protein
MVRITSIYLATALMFSLGTAIGPAQAQSPAYRAVPATAVASADSVIADGVLWRCGAEGCVATNATSRPAIVCAQAARKVGKLASFSVGTQPFDEAALAKCNAKAKG